MAEIRWEDDPRANDGESVHGWHDTTNATISVCRKLPRKKRAFYLLHELLHAADMMAEEETVESMTRGIAALFRLNPAVFTWIVNELAAQPKAARKRPPATT